MRGEVEGGLRGERERVCVYACKLVSLRVCVRECEECGFVIRVADLLDNNVSFNRCSSC